MNHPERRIHPLKNRLLALWAFCLFLAPPCLAASDNAPPDVSFAALCNQSFRALYQADGRILFATHSDEQSPYRVDKIICIDARQRVLWQSPVPPSRLTPFMDIQRTPEGSFAFLGCDEGGAYRIAFLDDHGIIEREQAFPPKIYSPVLSDAGAFFTVPSENEGIALWKMDWHGTSKRISIPPAPGLSIFRVILAGLRTYLLASYQNPSMVFTVICLDTDDNAAWQHEIGPFDRFSPRIGIPNDLGGLTLAIECTASQGTSGMSDMVILCLDQNGSVAWERKAASYAPVPHVMEQTDDGHYRIWGSIRKGQGPSQSFLLALDAHGNFLHSELKAQWGDCHRYRDGEVYAVVYSDGLAQGLEKFTDMESVPLAPFEIE